MPEHNPHRLTNERVGIRDGWRLLNTDEVGLQFRSPCPAVRINRWHPLRKSWTTTPFRGTSTKSTYRTQFTVQELAAIRLAAVASQSSSGYVIPHNPHRLTPEQVGVVNGWRLLDSDEVGSSMPIAGDGTIERWRFIHSRWLSGNWNGSSLQTCYRTLLTRKELRERRGLPPEAEPTPPMPPIRARTKPVPPPKRRRNLSW